jgi:hypothetical protein
MKPGGHSHCRLRIGRSGLTRGAEEAAGGIPNTLKVCNSNEGDPPVWKAVKAVGQGG